LLLLLWFWFYSCTSVPLIGLSLGTNKTSGIDFDDSSLQKVAAGRTCAPLCYEEMGFCDTESDEWAGEFDILCALGVLFGSAA
jgi:hypothetical protein